MTSDTPKRPIIMATRSMPSISDGMPTVNRGWPVVTSVPTMPSSSPTATMEKPFTGDPSPSIDAPIRQKRMSAK